MMRKLLANTMLLVIEGRKTSSCMISIELSTEQEHEQIDIDIIKEEEVTPDQEEPLAKKARTFTDTLESKPVKVEV